MPAFISRLLDGLAFAPHRLTEAPARDKRPAADSDSAARSASEGWRPRECLAIATDPSRCWRFARRSNGPAHCENTPRVGRRKWAFGPTRSSPPGGARTRVQASKLLASVFGRIRVQFRNPARGDMSIGLEPSRELSLFVFNGAALTISARCAVLTAPLKTKRK